MRVAYAFAERSTCQRARVGVAIAREGRILVNGYNGAPAGMPHCDHPDHMSEAERNNGCRIAVHAEANAIAWAARHGISLEGAELFTTYTPCLPCAQLIINCGITRVVAANAYRDKSGLELLQAAGLQIG